MSFLSSFTYTPQYECSHHSTGDGSESSGHDSVDLWAGHVLQQRLNQQWSLCLKKRAVIKMDNQCTAIAIKISVTVIGAPNKTETNIASWPIIKAKSTLGLIGQNYCTIHIEKIHKQTRYIIQIIQLILRELLKATCLCKSRNNIQIAKDYIATQVPYLFDVHW